jgi:hypothetical protein
MSVCHAHHQPTARARLRVHIVCPALCTRYYKNNTRVPFGKGERYYYTLTWRFNCEEDDDTVYFAHCYPYTYTDLQAYLTQLSQDPHRSKVCRVRQLCQTLAGNACDVLTITEYVSPTTTIVCSNVTVNSVLC